MSGVQGIQKTTLDLLELGLGVDVNHQVGAGNWTYLSSETATSALSHWTVPPAPMWKHFLRLFLSVKYAEGRGRAGEGCSLLSWRPSWFSQFWAPKPLYAGKDSPYSPVAIVAWLQKSDFSQPFPTANFLTGSDFPQVAVDVRTSSKAALSSGSHGASRHGALTIGLSLTTELSIPHDMWPTATGGMVG